MLLTKTIASLFMSAGLLKAQQIAPTNTPPANPPAAVPLPALPPEQQETWRLTSQQLVPRNSPAPARMPLPPGTQVHKDIEYVDHGGRDRTLDIFLPEKAGRKGGWCPALSLLTRGYAVVEINFRLCLVDKAPFPAQIYDCKAAVRWLRAHAAEYHLDPDHIGVWAHSSGSHLAVLLGVSGNVPQLEGDEGNLQYSSAVQAVVDWSGFVDPVTAYNYSPKNPKNGVVELVGSGDPNAVNEEKVIASSPLTYVHAGAPPFLIRHGTNDAFVSPKNSEKLYAALQAAGAESTYEPVPGQKHIIDGTDLEQEAGDFFDKHLKPAASKR
jgi:dienelactone hydrolase